MNVGYMEWFSLQYYLHLVNMFSFLTLNNHYDYVYDAPFYQGTLLRILQNIENDLEAFHSCS